MIRSAHRDTFTRDNLPPQSQWPEFLFDLPELQYPDRLNCVSELLDSWVAQGKGDRTCVISADATYSYAQFAERVNRIANVLTRNLGMVPGNRVLLRSPNSPMMIAANLAVMKAGGVVIATMPLLRAKELGQAIGKARISFAFCDARLADEMEKAKAQSPVLTSIVYWGNSSKDSLETLMQGAGYESFTACDTAVDDVCLIGMTSGTTGEPKGTMHFHRDILATCDTYGRHVLRASENDRFIGSAPIAFTFGLGGHVLFPFRVGAATIQLEKTPPEELLPAIAKFGATVCFTAPTAYKAMIAKLPENDISTLRKCVSAGETLPKPIFDAWHEATGIKIMDGIGSTEMLHIFIGSPDDEIRPGATGRAVPGYEAKVIDDEGRECAPGYPGRLAVRGPTGCRYLADPRQTVYVQHGWNVTGDTYMMDKDHYFWFQARSDDMIISSGYNIAGPEVEVVLLTHPAVAECGVVGAPNADRGFIVKAYIVLAPDHSGDDAMTRTLQDYVKAAVAPYKYPRAIEYVQALPRTQTGKLQRFALRNMAAGNSSPKA